MHTRENDCGECTETMWKGAWDSTKSIHQCFADCATDKDSTNLRLLVMCMSGCIVPVVFCGVWITCDALPFAGATACTPVTGLADCCIFSGNKARKSCESNQPSSAGPQRETMEEVNDAEFVVDFRQG